MASHVHNSAYSEVGHEVSRCSLSLDFRYMVPPIRHSQVAVEILTQLKLAFGTAENLSTVLDSAAMHT